MPNVRTLRQPLLREKYGRRNKKRERKKKQTIPK
jgi:hypothetical protein